MAPQNALIALALLICQFFCKTHATELPRTTHPCQRPCEEGKPPMTCRYNFTLDLYSSMSTRCGNCPFNADDCFNPGCVPAEGQKKALYLINQLLPGPSIEVCKGDRIIVDVKNELAIETTSIHWHGHHQSTSPFMDGVPFITQCPIPPGDMFRYDFVADKAGTLLWHSHSREQRSDGAFGSLIVRSASTEDVHGPLYDRDEHILILNDWTKIFGSETSTFNRFAKAILPHTILINGLGRYKPLKNKKGVEMSMPTAVFEVEQGKRYRFRIINAGAQDCPMVMAIDNHTMLVISSDGRDIRPVEVDSLRLLSGERYDVIVAANQEIDNYWMRFQGNDGSMTMCHRMNARQVSILRYKDASNSEPLSEIGIDIPHSKTVRLLNPYNKGTTTPGALCIPTLDSLVKTDKTSEKEPDHKFYISYDYFNLNLKNKISHSRNVEVPDVDSLKTTFQLNHINFKMPSVPILTQWSDLKPNELCNSSTVNNCNEKYCSCTHVLDVKLNSVVEVILIDEGYRVQSNHAIHLHGYYFRVVAMQKLNKMTTIEEVKRMDREGKIHRKLDFAPFKDTVMVPSAGFTIIRFHANNPGYWLMHCHYEMHSDLGMELLFKVGEHSDFPKLPVNFPKCNRYVTSGRDVNNCNYYLLIINVVTVIVPIWFRSTN